MAVIEQQRLTTTGFGEGRLSEERMRPSPGREHEPGGMLAANSSGPVLISI